MLSAVRWMQKQRVSTYRTRLFLVLCGFLFQRRNFHVANVMACAAGRRGKYHLSRQRKINTRKYRPVRFSDSDLSHRRGSLSSDVFPDPLTEKTAAGVYKGQLGDLRPFCLHRFSGIRPSLRISRRLARQHSLPHLQSGGLLYPSVCWGIIL